MSAWSLRGKRMLPLSIPPLTPPGRAAAVGSADAQEFRSITGMSPGLLMVELAHVLLLSRAGHVRGP